MHPMKVVVFDLDQTLGHFIELRKIWELLNYYFSNNSVYFHESISKNHFNHLLDLYPEFIRPNMFDLLNYLKRKKVSGQCSRIMLYTNNQASKEWSSLIVEYFHRKINYSLFDQIIGAFKINGKRIELGRTTKDKTISDFIRCTKLPKNTQICFLDDVHHPEMIHDNVYYIKLKPYVYYLSFSTMISRLNSNDFWIPICNNSSCNFEKFSEEYLKDFSQNNIVKTKEEHEIDEIVSKKIVMLVQDFFRKWKKMYTQKNRKSNNNITLKNF
jgi:hypothetical protein